MIGSVNLLSIPQALKVSVYPNLFIHIHLAIDTLLTLAKGIVCFRQEITNFFLEYRT